MTILELLGCIFSRIDIMCLILSINCFSVTLKIFRTDNALEFVQKEVENYCASLGILHQTSYPHTSQQNRVAERKYRHILDITHTILL